MMTSVSHTAKLIRSIPINVYLKAFGGGIIIILMTLVVGEKYIGLGLSTISDTLNPNIAHLIDIHWYTFILKTFFTSITLGIGGSGGIITPIFYVGATSGHFFGSIISSDHITLFAALGFISVLSATTNTPISSTIMAVELFGINIAHYAALGAVISFLISGHRSVFSSQILAIKKSEMLQVKIGEEIENMDISLEEYEIGKIKKYKDRLSKKNKKR